MKRLNISALAIFCLLITASTLYSQTEPCDPDCTPSTWVNRHLRINLRGCHPNCWVDIYYSSRIACPGVYNWQDVQITGIRTLTAACTTCSVQNLYQQVLYAVITKNDMGFSPQVGTQGCSQIWRVTAGACVATWREWFHDPTNQTDTVTIVQPCTESPCCLQSMTVCRYPRPGKADSVTISSPSTPFPTVNCANATIPQSDSLPPAPSGTTCQPMCDWLNNLGYAGSMPKMASNEDDVHHMMRHVPQVAPNPTNEWAEIKVDAPESGKMKLRIVDNAGQLVFEQEQVMTIGINTIRFSTRDLSSGGYLYQLIFEGKELSSGTFRVVR